MLNTENHYIDNIIWIIGTVLLFFGINKFVVTFIPRPKDYINNVKDDNEREYRIRRWKNIIVSFTHATITSIFISYYLIKYSYIFDDLINVTEPAIFNLNRFVFSYFLYDTIDNLLNDKKRKTYEIMLHHFVIIFCFSIVLVIRIYMGCLTVVLLLEINSVFLHLRHIMLHYNLSKKNLFYRINFLFNIFTNIVFRNLPIIYMAYWQYNNFHRMHTIIIIIASIGMVIFEVMNVTLLIRVVLSDLIRIDKKEKL